MANPFVHVELQTKDLDAAKAFYSRLFDWRLEDMPMAGGGTYTMIQVGEGTGGGMFANPDPKVPPFWLAYVGVDDVRSSTAKARELGADILVDCMAIEGYGEMSVFTDPAGATLAIWQNKMPDRP
jgi:predicted enzyme related to lactoylglutathione lyase